MTARTNPMISDFTDKPATDVLYRTIDAFVMGLGPVEKEKKAQVSYRVNRKFLWLWAYERTADSTLYATVTMDHPVHDENLHDVTQVSAHRWNHSIVVKALEDAESEWLRSIVREGFQFASR